MLVQDYMIFIMEENRMWQVQKKETFDIPIGAMIVKNDKIIFGVINL